MESLPSEIINIIAKHFGYVHWCQMFQVSIAIRKYLLVYKSHITLPTSYKAVKELIMYYDSKHIYEILQSRSDTWVFGDLLCCLHILNTKAIIAIVNKILPSNNIVLRQRYGKSQLLQQFINYELVVMKDVSSLLQLFGRLIQWSVKRNDLEFIKIFNASDNFYFPYVLSIYAVKYGRFYLYSGNDNDETNDLISFYAAKYEPDISSQLYIDSRYYINYYNLTKGAIYYKNHDLFLYIITNYSGHLQSIIKAVIDSDIERVTQEHIQLTKNLMKDWNSIELFDRNERSIEKMKNSINKLGFKLVEVKCTYFVIKRVFD